MGSLAHWCFTHRRKVVTGWLLVLIVVAAISAVAGRRNPSARYRFAGRRDVADYALPGGIR